MKLGFFRGYQKDKAIIAELTSLYFPLKQQSPNFPILVPHLIYAFFL